MLVSRILSRLSRSAGLSSSLAAVALPVRNKAPIFSSRFHSVVPDFSHKLLAAQVLSDSFSLGRFSFSSSTSSKSNEKESNTEASKTREEKATAEANESAPDSESKDSVTDSAQRRRKGAKRAAVSDTDSESSDDDEELSMDDLMKLVAEKEELLSGKEEEIKQMKDKVLRTYAEMENVMDRTRREAENTKKYAIQNFAKSLLDVADNLGRASSVVKESFSKLDTSKDSAGAAPLLKTLLEGVEMTEKQLAESGYTLYDRVIRPAEVGVTQGGENEEDKKESDA
ncbi:unnamed protein product [Thlaspi arvense]|uniref:GrpE protein homolog n=1 Tax=Thlaspi arvense TaxID=13288 RepID=A0AAU9T611_THLAR|nr:unnamed protein product [Thlaspi arvense]